MSSILHGKIRCHFADWYTHFIDYNEILFHPYTCRVTVYVGSDFICVNLASFVPCCFWSQCSNHVHQPPHPSVTDIPSYETNGILCITTSAWNPFLTSSYYVFQTANISLGEMKFFILMF